MKCHIVYNVRPFTKKEILRCTYGTCVQVPIFCCSWLWLAKLVRWLTNAEYICESLDERGQPEPVDDDSFETHCDIMCKNIQLVRK